MRKVTRTVIAAFLAGKSKSVANTSTDGQSLFLHGNCIAYKKGLALVVTTCGWNTNTTRERLNGLPCVNVYTKKGELFLNGEAWDGCAKEITGALLATPENAC